jgi:antitoxin component of MazEF toxin-antitoxin module
MGNQRAARLHTEGRTYEGEALLETAEILFRGERRLVIPLASIKTLDATDGRLTINGTVVLELGPDAAKWAEKIRNPKSVVQKLGVKAGQQVAVVHLDDPSFVAGLEQAGAQVTVGKPKKNSDAIFYGASSRDDLSRLTALKPSLAQNGALWVIRPKGVKTITEADTMAAGKAAGLVDVKVVKFSETHTAEKFVIRVADRR